MSLVNESGIYVRGFLWILHIQYSNAQGLWMNLVHVIDQFAVVALNNY